MPPNFADVSPPTNVTVDEGQPEPPESVTPGVNSTHAALKVVIRFLPAGATATHIILCVIGFQMLMAEGIHCLAPDSWCSTLSLKHQRWLHTGLQIMGSVLALVGCFNKIFDVGVNFTTYHAQFALASMIFITVSLVNGVASLYAYELRNCIPGILSKLTHICFGALTLITASISLAFAVNYVWFVAFLTTEYADAVLVMIGALTTIVIINPFLTMYAKFNGAISS